MMVITITTLVQLYSYNYMENDPNLIKFISYLSAFSGTMLLLVNASDMVIFFFG